MTAHVRTNLDRRGSALVIAMAIASVLAASAIVLTDIGVSRYQEDGRRKDQALLDVAAESAFNEAYAYFSGNGFSDLQALTLNTPRHYPSTDTGMFALGAVHNGCSVDVSVELLDGDPKPPYGDETFRIIATATAREKVKDADRYRRRRIEALIKPKSTSVFVNAMFAVHGYQFKGSASIDSFDSSVAAYALPKGKGYVNSNGTLGSNGSIDVQKASAVAGYDPSNPADTHVQSNLGLQLPVPTYTPPATATLIGGATGVTAGYRFTSPGTYRTARMNANGTIRIESGVVTLYVDGGIDWSSSQIEFADKTCQLVVIQNDTDESVSMKLSKGGVGQIVKVAGGTSTGDSRPQQLMWITRYSGEVTLNGNGKINGVVYAPFATFKMNGTFDFMGSVVGNAFGTSVIDPSDTTTTGKVNGNFAFHWDESLKALSPSTVPFLAIEGWVTRELAYGEN